MKQGRGYLLFILCCTLLFSVSAWGAAPIAVPFDEANSMQPLFEPMPRDAGRTLDAPGDPVDFGAALLAGAHYLRAFQADITDDNAGNGVNGVNETPDDPDDGGWDWALNWNTAPHFHSTSASPQNIYGATAQGLYWAYLATNNAAFMQAMQDAAGYMAGNAGIRSGADLKFLMQFDDLPGITGTTYQDAARAKYDARIATYGSATAFAAYIRDVRGITQNYPNGIIAWDIGIWAVVAQMLHDRYPGNGYDADADAIAEVIYQDSFMDNPGLFDIDDDDGWDPTWTNRNFWWYTLGITGLIDAFHATGSHTSEIPGLITRLQDSQHSYGAFSDSYGANAGDEDWQASAYIVMTLANYNASTYATEINYGAYWLGATQHAGGGWVYGSGNHYPEVGGECTAALSFGSAPDEVWVDDDWTDQASVDLAALGLVWGYNAFNNIQTAINNVGNSTVYVQNGTYNTTLNIYQDLTLIGESRAGVLINASAFSDYGIDAAGDYDFVFQSFTLDGPDVAAWGYGIKVSGDNATASVSDVDVYGCGRSGIDFNGLSSGSVTNVNAYNNGGVGLALTDCDDITVSNLTTSGNAWAGAAVFTKGASHTGGSDGVAFNAPLTMSEPTPLYTQLDPPTYYPITNLTVSTAAFPFKAGSTANIYIEGYYASKANAVAAAIGSGAGGWVYDRVINHFWVQGVMKIQAAINAAPSGGYIDVAAGTYAEALDVNKSVTIHGAGEGMTTINVAGLAGYNSSGIYVTANSTTLRGFTLQSNGANPPRYGIKYGTVNGGTLQNVTVQNIYRSGVDINGTSNLLVSDVTVLNTGGNGLQAGDAQNITFNNITTSGNAWGSIGIFVWGRYVPRGTSGIVIQGTCSFGEMATGGQGVYLESGDWNNPTVPGTITYSTSSGDGAQVTLLSGDCNYAMSGPQEQDFYSSVGYNMWRVHMYETLAQAQTVVQYVPLAFHTLANNRYIRTVNPYAGPEEFYVYDYGDPNVMSIQAAINAATGTTIYIGPGTYTENVVVTETVVLDGAGSGSNPASNTIINGAGGIGFLMNVGGNSAIDRLVFKDMRITGCSNGLRTNNAIGYVTLDNVVVTANSSYGLEIHNTGSINDLLLQNCAFTGHNTSAVRVRGSCTEFVANNCNFDGNSTSTGIGFSSWVQHPGLTTPCPEPTTFDDVEFNNCTFSNNGLKGAYFEKLSNAVFSNCVVSGSGTVGGYASGIDVNLKANSYSNISFNNLTMTNCGTGDGVNGTGLVVKGRNDGSSYSLCPASLTNVDVNGGTFTGCPINLSVGNNVTDVDVDGVTSTGGSVGLAVWVDAGKTIDVYDSKFQGNTTANVGDTQAGHTWNNNCYSDFASNSGFPTQYDIPGGGANVDYNPNPNNCSNVDFSLADSYIGCINSGTCNTDTLYLTIDQAGLVNLEVVIQMPAGFDLIGGPNLSVKPSPVQDPNQVSAWANEIAGDQLNIAFVWDGNAGGSSGNPSHVIAAIPVKNMSAATGTYAFAGVSTLYYDINGQPHVDEFMLGSVDIKVDCQIPDISAFANTATCAFGSAASVTDAFTATFGLGAAPGNSPLDAAWVTFSPGGGTYNLAAPGVGTVTFPPAGDAAAFYGYLLEGCNTLTLHLKDVKCNEATSVLANIGRDNTPPSLTVQNNDLGFCYNLTTGPSMLDDKIDITTSLAGACAASTGTLEIRLSPSGSWYSLPDPDVTNYPADDTEGAALWTWILSQVPGANGESYTFDVRACDCAGNCVTNSFTICVDITAPGNAVTAFDARPAHMGVWLKWAWAASAQAVEMRIYRSPMSGQYPGYAAEPDLWEVPANYDVTTVPPAGWTLVATQTGISGTIGSANMACPGNANNRGDCALHVDGGSTYWLDAQTGWVDGDGNATTYRDIYRYVTFVKDAGGNWSTGTPVTINTNADRATNYWLGDFSTADAAGDPLSRGYVDSDDLGLLSVVYFTNVVGDYRNIGPAVFDNGSIGKGIPDPDALGAINFQDLVPFSFNYNMVSPVGGGAEYIVMPGDLKPFGRLDAEPDVTLTIAKAENITVGSELTVNVTLTGNAGGAVKAVEVELDYPADVLEFVSATTADVSVGDAMLFTKAAPLGERANAIGIVAAACGGRATITDDALLAAVTFRVKSLEDAARIEMPAIRLLDNAGTTIEKAGSALGVGSTVVIPSAYALHQNFPNPFNPVTNIRFDLKEAGFVTLRVYNVLGQNVATLISANMNAGRHTVAFDARDLSSGLYIYTIEVNDFRNTKKMLLTR